MGFLMTRHPLATTGLRSLAAGPRRHNRIVHSADDSPPTSYDLGTDVRRRRNAVSGRNTEAGRSVLSKAFAILDALRSAETGLTRAQIARRTGLPMTTVHRLATELRRHGALEMTERGTYHVGPWLWEVGTLTSHTMTLRDLAIPFMEDLYEATHENVQLAVLDGHEALVVEKIRGLRSVPITSRVGGRLPLHATGVGKALLAFAPPEFIEEIIGRGLPPYTSSTITDPDALRRDLADSRHRGYAVTRDEMTVNAVSVAAAIRGAEDEVVGSISLVVEARGADVNRLAPPVRTVALGLSRRVGERWDLAAKVVPADRDRDAAAADVH
jgi:DNA-binding IclR family transcriptional regulator